MARGGERRAAQCAICYKIYWIFLLNADEILVMKDGSIIEQGSHEELMAKGGFYQNLYNSQFVKVAE